MIKRILLVSVLSCRPYSGEPVPGEVLLPSDCGLRSLWQAGLWQVSPRPLVSNRGAVTSFTCPTALHLSCSSVALRAV